MIVNLFLDNDEAVQMTGMQLAISLGVSLMVLVAVELVKWLRRRGE